MVILHVLLLCLLPRSIAAFAVVPPSLLSAALGIAFALTSPTTPEISSLPKPNDDNNVPVLEVVKVYGKLAGPECYGKQSPKGSSCQINLNDLTQNLFSSPSTALSKDDFAKMLEQMEFQWPLKPFGVDASASLSKTAVMNKGAETRVFMEELERRGLYDARNPMGPLPTSLRPTLNQQLQSEGILDNRAIDRTYETLIVGEGSRSELLRADDATTKFLDYYDFLKLFGPSSITWPK